MVKGGRRDMTAQEKNIIETILVDVGLESLHVGGTDDNESKLEPVLVQNHYTGIEYSN